MKVVLLLGQDCALQAKDVIGVQFHAAFWDVCIKELRLQGFACRELCEAAQCVES